MKENLQFEATYPFPTELVWQALTDPTALSRWMMPNNFKAEVGWRFEFKNHSENVLIRCEVVEVFPGKSVAFTWDGGEDEPPSVVAWTIQPTDDGGTRFRVDHQVMDVVSPDLVMEIGMNWRSLMHLPLKHALRMIRATRQLIPIVYELDEPETDTTRVAGLTCPGNQFAVATKSNGQGGTHEK